MSKRCPKCGASNEDSRIYCGSCGEPLDAQLRLIQNLEAQKKKAPVKEAAPVDDPEPAPRRRTSDDDDYNLGKLAKEKKSNPLPWILLGIAVAAVIIAFVVLS